MRATIQRGTIRGLLLMLTALSVASELLAAQESSVKGESYEFQFAPLVELSDNRPGAAKKTAGDTKDTTAADPLLGEGFDSLTGTPKGKSMVPDHFDPGTAGQKVEYSLLEVESLSDLRRELGVSASASYSGIGGGGSAKLELVRKASFNSYSIFVVVRTKVTNEAISLKEYLLRRESLLLLKRSPAEFFRTYGDEFVDTVLTGGEFFAVIEFVSQSSVEQESIRAEVHGSVGTFSGGVEFSQSLEKISKERVTKINVVRVGGAGPLPTNLKEAALNFPKEVDPKTGNPVVIGVTTRSYNVASNRDGVAVPDLQRQRRVLGELVEVREFGQRVKNDIAFIQDFPSQFEAVDSAALKSKSERIDQRIASIDQRLQQIVERPLDSPPDSTSDFADILPLNPRKSGVAIPLNVIVHQQNLGDLTFTDSVWAGARGSGLRLEGFLIQMPKPIPGLGIEYMAHLENVGDVPFKAAPEFVGTRGESRRLEGFAIRLTGPRAKYYRVIYRSYLSGVGESGTYEDGQFCGTRGQSRPLESMIVSLVSR